MVSPKVYSTNCAFKYIPFPHVYFEFLKSIRASTCYQLVRLHRYIYNFLKKKNKNWENTNIPKLQEEVVYTYFPFPFCFIR